MTGQPFLHPLLFFFFFLLCFSCWAAKKQFSLEKSFVFSSPLPSFKCKLVRFWFLPACLRNRSLLFLFCCLSFSLSHYSLTLTSFLRPQLCPKLFLCYWLMLLLYKKNDYHYYYYYQKSDSRGGISVDMSVLKSASRLRKASKMKNKMEAKTNYLITFSSSFCSQD